MSDKCEITGQKIWKRDELSHENQSRITSHRNLNVCQQCGKKIIVAKLTYPPIYDCPDCDKPEFDPEKIIANSDDDNPENWKTPKECIKDISPIVIKTEAGTAIFSDKESMDRLLKGSF
jgi:DNA-directed RNA polymerase subunit RPC12/RpoP